MEQYEQTLADVTAERDALLRHVRALGKSRYLTDGVVVEPEPEAVTEVRTDSLPEGGYLSHCCVSCKGRDPRWTLVCEGDVVVAWACDHHLTNVLDMMQRPHRDTRIIVTRSKS